MVQDEINEIKVNFEEVKPTDFNQELIDYVKSEITKTKDLISFIGGINEDHKETNMTLIVNASYRHLNVLKEILKRIK